ncbi:succinylglutamate desuccinylase [Shewanella marina]|uniref:succinylglutamate desuccinylase n=1 Tax=Shewanella marina TaxID=487319 RepID=UPI0004708128|nr:succinylglutamate desuccinylase [Shewanella marina]
METMLMEQKDFLQLTLDNPNGIEQTFSYKLADNTLVSVLDTGVITFEPEHPHGKDIILSCGVHGNETSPIELCNGLITAILSGQIEVKHRLMFIIGNPHAILNFIRFIDENMNRMFSGAHSRGEGLINPERIRAAKLEQYVDQFYAGNQDPTQRIHYDLHTSIRGAVHPLFAVYPYRQNKPYLGREIMFMHGCGVDTILFHHEPTTTFSYYSSAKHHADAFTVELGKVFPLGENDMSLFEEARLRLTELICDMPLQIEAYEQDKVNLFQVCRTIVKQTDAFKFTFSNDILNFTAFEKGHEIATDGDLSICIEASQEYVVFPNAKVPVGQRSLVCLIKANSIQII